MAKKRSDSASVSAFADHDVIIPPHKLHRAVTMTGRGLGPDIEAIEKAEAALAELAGEFSTWMVAEADRLDDMRQRARRIGMGHAVGQDLFRAAHDIKGHATTFGYPLAADVAESLCRLIEHSPGPAAVPFALVDQHVDAIRAIIREDVRDAGNAVGARLAAGLRQVTDEFLVKANSHRPGYLDGIVVVAPPIVTGK